MAKTEYEAVIGLEIHIQINTKSKMFCGSDNAEVEEPNVNVCPICMGHPGTLPVVNDEAIKKGLAMALALNCKINQDSKFDRKQYFYPDLPKGYQISQYDLPLAEKGYLEIYPDNITPMQVKIERLHLEEDTAKIFHTKDGVQLDFNRAGSPLMEIVTEPDFDDPAEAKLFLQDLQIIARYLDVSDADMEKGHLRCDANISIREKGDKALYPKTEIKNLNSFRAVENALNFEIKRQTRLWEDNEAPDKQETRGWNDKKKETVPQRAKEGLADYRYFPEPDIPPLVFEKKDIQKIEDYMPALPHVRRERFMQEYGLSYVNARIVTNNPKIADYFEDSMSELQAWLYSLDNTEGSDEEIWTKYGDKVTKMLLSTLTTEVFGLLKENNQDFIDLKITPENIAELITLKWENKLNSANAKKVLRVMFDKGSDPSQVMEEEDLEQVQDVGEIDAICDRIIKNNPDPAEDFKNGKEKSLMFLVGQAMKESKGKANPQMLMDIFHKKLDNK
ncbi:Asp-tRNA(Asn)/Glu-tRNA(Gln) amidotransferase subunit GatB [Patescibacteria group bacterium]|nr:Asp-tRNA(Asn)/Glu-tRNA(Gln) amidotransferase subunit GatB [Patescibacteria group bacterium]MBU1672875.1 Asp-tRNA(Asn)/Glu-tRNA(Gln) amidotransferase subunit GatB [Patescibacteria group bacterium]MBU1963126.1 Asp-tRNA(Asn)/Glu-tRNA(Gln) amidotransferase subunit GatB [Patescibacteria group bacterium]